MTLTNLANELSVSINNDPFQTFAIIGYGILAIISTIILIASGCAVDSNPEDFNKVTYVFNIFYIISLVINASVIFFLFRNENNIDVSIIRRYRKYLISSLLGYGLQGPYLSFIFLWNIGYQIITGVDKSLMNYIDEAIEQLIHKINKHQ